jgi:threonylcarbamoyladenosine tRNA methylthiotransferase CDKAL1
METVKGGYFLYANSAGCPQNQLDSAQIAKYLQDIGYFHVKNPRDADLIIVNSCSHREEREVQALNAAKALSIKAKPGARIIISGCLPKIAPDRLKSLSETYEIIPATELKKLEKLIPNTSVSIENCEVNYIPEQFFRYERPFRRFLAKNLGLLRDNLPRRFREHCDRLLMYDHTPKSYIVRVAEGCLGNCTYCAIRFARGTLRSKPFKDVLREVKSGLDSGVKEILLTATELTAYGRDIGTNIAELLSGILKIPGNFKILLFNGNPRWMIDISDKIIPIFSTGRIHFAHLSVNGANEKVLHRMQRGYTLKEFAAFIDSIRNVSPDTILQTEVIVGFPGETQEDFEETRSFFRRNFFHNVRVYAFSERPGTPAEQFPDKIPVSVRNKRRRILYLQTLFQKTCYNVNYIKNRFRTPNTSAR